MTAEEVVTKMNKVWKAMRSGSFEHEEVFESLEIYFKQLQQFIIDLSKSAEVAVEAPKPEAKADKKLIDDLTIINQIFKCNDRWQTKPKTSPA